MAEWKEVATAAEFVQTDRKLVDLGEDRIIGLFKIGGEYFAVSGWCSHQKSSLVHGEVDGYEVICPLHGARFDLRTGRHLSLPAVRPIATFPVKLDGDKILVEV